MPGGVCGLYRNTRGARVARGEIKPDAQRGHDMKRFAMPRGMTLKQAIKRCQEQAKESADGEFYLQLAEWLTELHGWRQFFNASGKVCWAPVDDRTKTKIMEDK